MRGNSLLHPLFSVAISIPAVDVNASHFPNMEVDSGEANIKPASNKSGSKKRRRTSSGDHIELEEEIGSNSVPNNGIDCTISSSIVETVSGIVKAPKKKKKLEELPETSVKSDHLEKFHYMTPDGLSQMRAELLAWYDEVRRPLLDEYQI